MRRNVEVQKKKQDIQKSYKSKKNRFDKGRKKDKFNTVEKRCYFELNEKIKGRRFEKKL